MAAVRLKQIQLETPWVVLDFQGEGTYTGQAANSRPDGFGTFVYSQDSAKSKSDGWKSYTGSWKRGSPYGRGSISYLNGARYDGNVVDGKRAGRGVMSYKPHDHARMRFRGKFERDRKIKGIIWVTVSGKEFSYDGEFNNVGHFHDKNAKVVINGTKGARRYSDDKWIDKPVGAVDLLVQTIHHYY